MCISYSSQRLGPKSPGRGRGRGNFTQNRSVGRGRAKGAPNTQFNVVGLGKFDARQKLSNNPLKTTIVDAREKIRGRTFDARQKLEKNKKPVDVRQKIESMKAQKDARSKIKARKGAKGIIDQKMVAGNASAQSVSMTHGSLTKTIRTSNNTPATQVGVPRNIGLHKSKPQTGPLTRTVCNVLILLMKLFAKIQL